MLPALPPTKVSSASTVVPDHHRVSASELAFLEGSADSLEHEPCRLLSNAKRPCQFVDETPFLQFASIHTAVIHLSRPRRNVHDRPDLHGELLLARIAEPQAARLDERKLLRSAAGAVNLAIRQANESPLKGALRVCGVGNRFWRVFRTRPVWVSMRRYYTNTHVCQGYSYRLGRKTDLRYGPQNLRAKSSVHRS